MIVIAEKYGLMCNRIMTYANIMAFAIEHNLTVYNPSFDEYCHLFPNTNRGMFARFPMRSRSRASGRRSKHLWFRGFNLFARLNKRLKILPAIDIGWRDSLHLDDEASCTAILRSRSLVFLSGMYFLDGSHLRKHAADVKEYFRPSQERQGNVDRLIQKAREDVDVLVGFHVRQGDYADFCNGIYHYSNDEYRELMRSVVKLFDGRRVRFLICSNEKQDLAFYQGLLCCLGTGDVIEDLYSLAGCDYIVAPPSTYSGWASFFGDVPRFVVNYKQEEMNGLCRTPMELDRFAVVETFADHS